MNADWTKTWKEAAKELREKYMATVAADPEKAEGPFPATNDADI